MEEAEPCSNWADHHMMCCCFGTDVLLVVTEKYQNLIYFLWMKYAVFLILLFSVGISGGGGGNFKLKVKEVVFMHHSTRGIFRSQTPIMPPSV